MAERTVVVTGGGTGIGAAIAAAFAADGERVVILGRREDVLRETAAELAAGAPDAAIHWKTCDVGEPEQIDGFVRWLIDEVSPTVDVLVNNAGGSRSRGVEPEASAEEAATYARDMLATNLVGVYVMIHALRPHLRRPGGRIVKISSSAAFRGGWDMSSL